MYNDESEYLAFPSRQALMFSMWWNLMTLPGILEYIIILMEFLVTLPRCKFKKKLLLFISSSLFF